MEIQYLTYLRDNPDAYPNNIDDKDSIKPISLQEIEQLEQLYNNGGTFPRALRELLFLAGKSCYVLDYGIYNTQEKMQEFVRRRITATNRVINRPFFAVDTYNGSDQFIFVYLDEGDNPPTYEGHFYHDPIRDYDQPSWIWTVTPTLSDLINHGIDRVKQGRNPF
jgi:hypothetical protein